MGVDVDVEGVDGEEEYGVRVSSSGEGIAVGTTDDGVEGFVFDDAVIDEDVEGIGIR